MGWWLPIRVTSIATEPTERWAAGVLRARLAAERERDVSLLARGRTWPKWSAFLNASQDFCILNVIAWVDAYNLQTGSNFLQELCFLFWKGTAQWRVRWVSNTCYYTFLWPENWYCLCLHPYSACILWITQPRAACLRLAAFYFLFFCGTGLSLCLKLQLKAVIAPPQFCPNGTGVSPSAKTMEDATYICI